MVDLNPPTSSRFEPASASPPIVTVRAGRSRIGIDTREVWRYRELLLLLVWRDLTVRYKQTVLGATWAILQPLVTVAAFTYVFRRLGQLPTDALPGPLFYATTLVPWTYLSSAVTAGTNSLVNSQHLIAKVYFPRVIVPLTAVSTPLVDWAISSLVVFGFLVHYRHLPAANVLALPVVVLLAALLALSLSLWLSALNALYRDVKHVIPFAVQLWLFLSPVAYPLAMIPEPARRLYVLNPAVAVLEGFRWCLTGRGQVGPEVVLSGVAMTLVLLISGSIVFRRVERQLADVV